MRNKWAVSIAILLILVSMVACAAKGDRTLSQPRENAEREMVVVEKAARAPIPRSAGGSYGEVAKAASDVGKDSERMIVRTVDMMIVVDDTDVTLTAIHALVKTHDGYISGSHRWISDDQPRANITLRVPAESLDEVLDHLHGMAIRVENENISGEDVTEEYIDLEARLRNMEATEKELLVLLTEVRENRGKAEDVLAIYREITDIRGQIESLKGRTQYLERSAALATIHVNIEPKETARALVEKAKWDPMITLNKALRAFVTAFQVVVNLLIYVLIFSPFILVPVLILWLLVRWVRRRAKNKATKTEK